MAVDAHALELKLIRRAVVLATSREPLGLRGE
jgi:hypothetical protein